MRGWCYMSLFELGRRQAGEELRHCQHQKLGCLCGECGDFVECTRRFATVKMDATARNSVTATDEQKDAGDKPELSLSSFPNIVDYLIGTWKRSLRWQHFGGSYQNLRTTNT